MDICFHIPDFFNHFYLNLLVVNAVKRYPECFHDNLKIASAFGNFPGVVWNGGRFVEGRIDMKMIRHIIKNFNELGVALRFTCTNPMIEERHFGDYFCNQILKTANNGLNEVIVMSPALEEYIRKNHPGYKITSSTCKEIRDIEGVKEELKKDYHYVVLDYNLNNQFDLLEQIDEEERSRCELLVNACCIPNCPRRGEHYRTIGMDHIKEWEYNRDPKHNSPFFKTNFTCEAMSKSIYDITEYSTHISPDDIFEKYLPMGFNNFKIEGRTLPDIALLETYIYYMVKPEHKDRMRFRLLSALTNKYTYFSA